MHFSYGGEVLGFLGGIERRFSFNYMKRLEVPKAPSVLSLVNDLSRGNNFLPGDLPVVGVLKMLLDSPLQQVAGQSLGQGGSGHTYV